MTHTRLVLACALVVAAAGSQVAGQITIGGATTTSGAPAQILNDLIGGVAPQGTKPMPVGGGIIVGRVIDGVDGTPIAGAIVSLALPGFTPERVQADGSGQFAFRALPEGAYTISSSRPGWVDGAVGRTRPGGPGRAVTLDANGRVGDVDIPMWRFASISGVVLDENNEPLVGASVRTLRRTFTGGRHRLTSGPSDTTDDRGQFRIGGLEAGEYIVVVPIINRPSLEGALRAAREGAVAGASGGGGGNMVFAVRAEVAGGGGAAPVVISSLDGAAPPAAGLTEDGLPLTYQTEYFTGALSADRATPVVVTHGEARMGVDFTMRPVRALRVSGSVTGPDGPTPGVQVQLLPADSGDMANPIEVGSTNTDDQGRFTFELVPAGRYILHASRQARGQNMTFTQSDGNATFVMRQTVERMVAGQQLPTQPTLWSEQPLSVGTQDLADVGVALREGLTVSGSIAFTGSAAQPTPEQRSNISISLEPADGRTAGLLGIARGRVDESGSFTTIGVPAGRYVLRVSGAPQGWTLRDASFAGRDITSSAIELRDDNASGVLITFTDRTTGLTGTVRDRSGNAGVAATVLVFPADQALWVDTGSQPRRLKQTRVRQDGSYTVSDLPAGDYYVIALPDKDAANWQDPAFLAQISRSATTVRLADGDTRTQALIIRDGGAR